MMIPTQRLPPPPPRPQTRWVLAFMLALGLSFGGVHSAQAHNEVEDRTPAPGSSVADSPVRIAVTTDDDFLDLGGNGRGFALVAQDSSGLYYGDGCGELLERQMVADIELGGPGTYSVSYQFVSADGHSVSGSYDFDFAPEPGHTPAPGAPLLPECAQATEDAGAAVTVPAGPLPQTDTSEGANITAWFVGAGALALLATLVVALWRRNRSQRT